jgi:hypothetical protein
MMGNPLLKRRAIAAASLAAALFACERSEPVAVPAPSVTAPTASVDLAAVSTEPAEPAEPDAIVIPPFDPSLPSLKLEPPPVPEAQPPQVPAAKPKIPAPQHADESTAPASAEPAHPPLDALLRPRYEQPGASTSVDLGRSEPVTAPVAPKPPRTLDRLGDSIRLERRGEAIGPAGPRQGTAWETQAGLKIPVDESVSLEGGVRLDSREEPGAKPQPARKTPQVGVEVRF